MQDIVAQVSLKICKRCKQELPTSCFHSNSGTKDRLASNCKTCVAENSRKHYLANREKRLAQIAAYHRAKPEIKRASVKRYKEKYPERRKAYREKNKDKILAGQKRWAKANPEKRKETYRRYDAKRKDERIAYRQTNADKILESKRRWRAANPEKARATDAAYRKKRPDIFRENARRRRAILKGAPVIEKIDRAAIIQRDNSTCWLCHKKLEAEQITLDHVIPLSKGGSHTATNLRVACVPCNSKKGNQILTLF